MRRGVLFIRARAPACPARSADRAGHQRRLWWIGNQPRGRADTLARQAPGEEKPLPSSFVFCAECARRRGGNVPRAPLHLPHLRATQRLGFLLGQHDALDGPLRETLKDGGHVQGAAPGGRRESARGAPCRAGRATGQGRGHPAHPQVQGARWNGGCRQAGRTGGGEGQSGAGAGGDARRAHSVVAHEVVVDARSEVFASLLYSRCVREQEGGWGSSRRRERGREEGRGGARSGVEYRSERKPKTSGQLRRGCPLFLFLFNLALLAFFFCLYTHAHNKHHTRSPLSHLSLSLSLTHTHTHVEQH